MEGLFSKEKNLHLEIWGQLGLQNRIPDGNEDTQKGWEGLRGPWEGKGERKEERKEGRKEG